MLMIFLRSRVCVLGDRHRHSHDVQPRISLAALSGPCFWVPVFLHDMKCPRQSLFGLSHLSENSLQIVGLLDGGIPMIIYGCYTALGFILSPCKGDRCSSSPAQSRTLVMATLYRLFQRQALLDGVLFFGTSESPEGLF